MNQSLKELPEKKKGLYAPLLPLSGAGSTLDEIYITIGGTLVSWITKTGINFGTCTNPH